MVRVAPEQRVLVEREIRRALEQASAPWGRAALEPLALRLEPELRPWRLTATLAAMERPDEAVDSWSRLPTAYKLANSKELGQKLVDRLGIEIEGDGFETVGGWVLARAGRVPLVGERFEFDGLAVEVIEAERRRIHKVRISRVPPEPADVVE